MVNSKYKLCEKPKAKIKTPPHSERLRLKIQFLISGLFRLIYNIYFESIIQLYININRSQPFLKCGGQAKMLNLNFKYKHCVKPHSDRLGRFGLLGSRKSFTLIEALTSVTIFMIISTILINIYVATVRGERIAYTILRDSDTTQTVLETMSRAIRMGSDFELAGNTSLTFKTEEEGKKFFTMFRYQYDDIEQKGWIERVKYINQADLSLPSDSVIKPGDVIRLTPDNMNIDDFMFEVFGEAGEQKNVLIKFSTVSTVYKTDYKTFVQTSITPRLFITN